MRWPKILFLVVSCAWWTLPAAATEPGQTVNGCGPNGILGRIVPNRIRIVNCELEKACNAHDICYGRCLQGGNLNGNPTCKDEAARKVRRLACDDALFASIGAANDNRLACRAAARLYKSFVRAAGSRFFFGIRAASYAKEELYRVPKDFIDGGGFAIEFGVQVEGKLDKNYAATDAFVRYAESHPGTLTKAEIDAALDSIEANAMRQNTILVFRSGPSGAELIVKGTSNEADPDMPNGELVIWRGGG